jgi:hypothetical protein
MFPLEVWTCEQCEGWIFIADIDEAEGQPIWSHFSDEEREGRCDDPVPVEGTKQEVTVTIDRCED